MSQHLYTHAEWIAAGGWQPSGITPGADWLVIAGVGEQGQFVWASWGVPTVDPATRIGAPCIDQRAATRGATIMPVTPPVPAPTPEERLAAARQALAALDALPSPVLTADVVDVLDDLRGVL